MFDRGSQASAVVRVAKNATAGMVTSILNRVVSLVLVLFIARSLGAEWLGRYATVIAFYGIFAILPGLGLSPVVTREVAREPSSAGRYLANTSFIGIVSAACFLVLAWAAQSMIGYPPEVGLAIGVLSLALIPGSIIQVAEAIFKGLQRFEYLTLVIGFEGIAKALISIAVLSRRPSLMALIVIILALRCAAALAYLVLLRLHITRASIRIEFNFCRQLIGISPIFIGICIFSAMFSRIDVVMLSKMKDPIEVGFYTAAYKLMQVWFFVPVSLTGAVYPLMSQSYQSWPQVVRASAAKSIRYLLILLLPIAFGTTLIADKVIAIFYGQQYANSIVALQILIWTLIPFTMNQIFASLLLSNNRQSADLATLAIGVASHLLLLSTLIPRLGYIGASVATLASMLLLCAVRYIYVTKRLVRINLAQLLWKPTCSAILMALVIVMGREMNMWILIALSAIIYAISLVALGTFSTSDLLLIRRLGEIRRLRF